MNIRNIVPGMYIASYKTATKGRLTMKTISQLAAFAFVLFLTGNAQAAVICDQSNA